MIKGNHEQNYECRKTYPDNNGNNNGNNRIIIMEKGNSQTTIENTTQRYIQERSKIFYNF